MSNCEKCVYYDNGECLGKFPLDPVTEEIDEKGNIMCVDYDFTSPIPQEILNGEKECTRFYLSKIKH